MRVTFSFALRMCIMLLLPLAIVLNWQHSNSQSTFWGERFAAGAVVLSFVGWYTRKTYISRVVRTHFRRNIYPLARARAYELLREVGRDPVNRTQATLFSLAVRMPSTVRQRVAEEYVPGQSTLQQRVTVEIQVPRGFLEPGREHDAVGFLPDTFPFPLIICPKSTLYDGLEVLDSHGEAVSTLTYGEYLALAANALHWRFVSAFGGTLPTDNHVHDLEVDALMQIISPRNDDRCTPAELGRRDAETDEVVDALCRLEAPHPEDLLFAAELVKTLAKHYVIVAPLRIPANGRTSVSYRRIVIPSYSCPPQGQIRDWIGKLRFLARNILGARPTDVRLNLDNAGTSNSFHVSVQAPEGLYLSSQQLALKTDPVRLAAGAPHFRFRSRLGQSHAHFYGRQFPRPQQPDEIPELVFRFHEVPPGSDFQATAAALSAAFLIGLIGFVLSHVHPQPNGRLDVGSDAAVLLLAFPGVVASWLGLDKTSTPLFNGSLSARLSLLCTVTLSALASALYIINGAGIEPDVFNGSLGGGVSLLGITKDWWVGISAFAVANALWISYRCFVRALRYVHLSHRSSSG